MKQVLIFLTLTLLSACASNIPIEIKSSIEGSPALEEVLQKPEKYVGKQVRWGGSIASIENKENETWIEIVSRELNSSGRPIKDDETSGRFIAIVKQFLDPDIYSKGRFITVNGELTGSRDGKIGDQSYVFPMVDSVIAHLWPEYHEPLHDPYLPHLYRGYYDPFWDPYWDLRWRSRYYGYPRFWY